MTPETLALIQLLVKFGIDGAIAIMTSIKGAHTIDDAIAALEVAKTKTAQMYLDEAKASVTVTVTPAPGPVAPPSP